jgi:NitT/TauT family transport system substrate-binding protein
MKSKKNVMLWFIIIIMIIMTTSCAVKKNNSEKESLIIADQFGLAYAPIEIMKAKDFLRQELDEVGALEIDIEWKRMGNTASMREAMVSGDLDIGFVGIPPFLIGRDNGMDWKIISGISESPSALVTTDASLVGIEDITKDHRIILPQPGSIQHILLAMYAEKIIGNAKAFDQQLQTLAHPDGLVAMSTGDPNQLHFTTPPFLQKELEIAGAKVLVDGETCFGEPFTFIVGICPQRVYDDRVVYEAFERALERSVLFMAVNPDETLSILAEAYEYPIGELQKYLSNEQMEFTTEIKGVDVFIDFMTRNGWIESAMDEAEVLWRSNGQ